MFVTITIALTDTRFSYYAEKKTEITLEGELATLQVMSYGIGETVGSGMAALVTAEQDAQRKAETETVATNEE